MCSGLQSTPIFKVSFVAIFSELYFFSIDTDECELRTHNCARVAACINTRGSFMCQCPSGYSGDGFDCSGKLYYTI